MSSDSLDKHKSIDPTCTFRRNRHLFLGAANQSWVSHWAWNSCETPGRDKIRRHLTLAVTLTHEAENGTNTPALLARSRYASVRSLERYAPSGPEAVARRVVFRWKYRESVTALAYEPAVPSMNAPVLASMNTTRYEGAFSAGSPGGGPAEGARKPGGMVRETAQASA